MSKFSIEIISDRAGLKDFIRLPFQLYKDDANWVAPVKLAQNHLFSRKKHPFHEHADVEYALVKDEKGKTCGRTAFIINHAHNKFHNDRTAFFGFLEAIREQEVFDLLLNFSISEMKKKKMSKLVGPMNYSTNEECGLLVKGFDASPLLMMPYNPPWYEDMIENAGFSKARDLLAYLADTDTHDFSRLERIATYVKQKADVRMRDIRKKKLRDDIFLIMDIYNECWKQNWGFIPMTQSELIHMGDELKPILIPSLAPIIEINGEAVAFAVALPDANQVMKVARGNLIKAVLALKVPPFKIRINRVRVLLMGVKPAFRGRGLEAVMIDQIVRESAKMGIKQGELSWILEDNQPMRKILEKDLGMDPYKVYRIFMKEISGSGPE